MQQQRDDTGQGMERSFARARVRRRWHPGCLRRLVLRKVWLRDVVAAARPNLPPEGRPALLYGLARGAGSATVQWHAVRQRPSAEGSVTRSCAGRDEARARARRATRGAILPQPYFG